MKHDISIKDVMHPAPHSVAPSVTADVALKMMREHNFRHLPVQEAGKLIGLVTERDINFALRFDKVEPSELLIRDAYYPEPYTVTPETSVSEVARRMAHDHFGCALVMEKNHLVGIFTTVDACRLLAETLSGKQEQ